MNWQKIFTTSIGRKLVMAFSGLSLIGFLIVHCYINSLMFLDDSGEKFVDAATFMSSNLIIRIMEVGLFGVLILHIIESLILTLSNNKKRPVKYKISAGNQTSKWYSRYMGVLGSLILLFLITHLGHFWAPNRFGQFHEESDMWVKMKDVFSSPANVIIYVLGCVSLAIHLLHGFSSAFQTMGLMHNKYKSLIENSGKAFSIIVPAIFAAMPIWMYFHFQ